VSWQPTAALLRVSVLPAALALVGVLARRPDLLALAAPLALAAVPLAARPRSRPRATARPAEGTLLEDAETRLLVTVDDADGAGTAAVALAAPGGVRVRGRTAVQVPTAGRAALPVELAAEHWGWSDVGPGTVLLSACGGLLRADLPVPVQRLRVLPLSVRYRGAALLPRARGNVGLHRSRVRGEGTDLTGVRPFTAGDRIRRINWRTSVGPGGLSGDRLQVNATTTERDADVVVLLDARFTAGDGLDRAARATAAVSAFYLELGDRVGLVTYSTGVRVLAARGGRGQLERVFSALLETATPRVGGAEPALVPPAGLDPRALVLLVSPLVGRQVFAQAAALGRAGHTVVVVDTLPPDVRLEDAFPDGPGPWTTSVARLWAAERDTRIGTLRSLGVPVVPWRGAGSLDAVLAELTRSAGRPGMRR
jgi:uncharacterized protein (DUF58 family)